MKKMDEMEGYQSGVAARFSFAFYTLALLIWSIINYIKNGDLGWQFSIAMVGCAIFLWIRVAYKHKTK